MEMTVTSVNTELNPKITKYTQKNNKAKVRKIGKIKKRIDDLIFIYMSVHESSFDET